MTGTVARTEAHELRCHSIRCTRAPESCTDADSTMSDITACDDAGACECLWKLVGELDAIFRIDDRAWDYFCNYL